MRRHLLMLSLSLPMIACSEARPTNSPNVGLAEACEVTVLALTSNTSDARPWKLGSGLPHRGNDWRSEEVVLQLPAAGEDPDWYWGWHKGFTGGSTPVRSEGPSVEMARAFARSRPAEGSMCPQVRRLADEADERFAGLDNRPDDAQGDGTHPRSHVELERAVLSDDGREAIVYLGQQFAPLAGGGFLILYRKDAEGQWSEEARLPVWIS
jgi:hypothetical protein